MLGKSDDHIAWNDGSAGIHTNTAVSFSVSTTFDGGSKTSLVSEGPWPDPNDVNYVQYVNSNNTMKLYDTSSTL